ncbi:MAG: 2Fe-2S iron-sulfur cluster-binding protein [Rhodobacter sp.]|nr:2Fe-2S iron-sulfur cluster-binding protein [Rhodobacter sp.]
MTETVRLTVNGEECSVNVPPRAQLTEVLRDHLELTGTHLGCEHGVCGACTVMFDGKPVRSCITFAKSCEGADVETIEGHRGDKVMAMLREAFSRHHGLQCGFCTPGMLATARDIVARFDAPDEKTIRTELSGNLCRCTGYVGIVRAIQDVIDWRNASGLSAAGHLHPEPPVPTKIAPFSIRDETIPAFPPEPAGRVRTDGTWTTVNRDFSLTAPTSEVRDLFADIWSVASCIPGATVTNVTENRFEGNVEIRFGPIRATFRGIGGYSVNEGQKTGKISGRGDDRNGQSKLEGEMTYNIGPGTHGGSLVSAEIRFRIEGLLAQFNRPELVTGFVDYLLTRFTSNCEAVLSGGKATEALQLSVLSLAWSVLRSRLRKLFGHH